MDRIGQYQTSNGDIAVFADGLSGKEHFADGAFEVLDFGAHIKLRFFSNTGLAEGDAAIVEHTQTIVLPKSALGDLTLLLDRLGQEAAAERPQSDTENPAAEDKLELFREV